jgi:hypothetical protein
MTKDKPDLTLSDGREITFDLNKITVSEWRAFVENIQAEVEDDLIERCGALEKGEIAKMGMGDYRLIGKVFYRRIREPLEDPN